MGRRKGSSREGLVSSSLVFHLEMGTWSKRRKAGEALLTGQVNQTGIHLALILKVRHMAKG